MTSVLNHVNRYIFSDACLQLHGRSQRLHNNPTENPKPKRATGDSCDDIEWTHVWLVIPRGHVHVTCCENKCTGHVSVVVQHNIKYSSTVNMKLVQTAQMSIHNNSWPSSASMRSIFGNSGRSFCVASWGGQSIPDNMFVSRLHCFTKKTDNKWT